MNINLKQFYELTRQEKKDYINQLKLKSFKELTDAEKGIVFFWYQNWLLESWPIAKKNFISIDNL
jgi:hypothetical protein